MGDFDNWSHGFSLSPEDIQDQTFTCFHSDIPLLPVRLFRICSGDCGSTPRAAEFIACSSCAYTCMLQGEYQVKFLVDSEWRLAPEWPITTTADGSTNNLLVVE